MKYPIISFSHNYLKLNEVENKSKCKLLMCTRVNSKDLSLSFKMFDSLFYVKNEANYFKLPEGELIFLLLIEIKSLKLFPTLRSYNESKFRYYSAYVNSFFEVKINVNQS